MTVLAVKIQETNLRFSSVTQQREALQTSDKLSTMLSRNGKRMGLATGHLCLRLVRRSPTWVIWQCLER